MNARIEQIGVYVPEGILKNSDLEKEFSDWNSEKIEKSTGIRERRIAAEGETALDLAEKASEKVFETYDRNRIDFVLLSTQSPDYYLPTSACILQDRLGLKTTVGALDFNLGCSGFVYGLAMAKGLIQGGIAERILLVTSDTMTKHVHPKDKSNRTIFGDGAAATIIEASEAAGIHQFSLGTDGSGYRNLIVPNGGLRHRFDPQAHEIEDDSGSVRTDNTLYMNGAEIFNFTLDAVPKVYADVLKKNDIEADDVDYVIFHQANKFMIDYLRKKLKISKEKFYINLLHTGNTVSSTIPFGLRDCLDRGVIQKKDRIMVIGFGVGYSWGGTIIQL